MGFDGVLKFIKAYLKSMRLYYAFVTGIAGAVRRLSSLYSILNWLGSFFQFLIYDSAAETPCYAINITFYCHPERSEGSFVPGPFALAQDDTKIIAVT
ncbi:MAG: hypothetical protein P4L49_20510 [Desulfosporosinus sp.]|nr:hypothetical protein [Desulfosporosinus sp.]